MLDQDVVFLDLETTGANAAHDRITEIGLVEVSGGRLAGEWSTLVNPETRIPPAIEALTGISNAMVADAPRFAALSRALRERLAGKLIVAHNARFDYGFLRQEFRRTGLRFQARVLCTVKLSRRLYPGEHRHNLDSLIERHGLRCEGRHRALGDARVLWEFVQQVQQSFGAAAVGEAAAALLRAPALPAGLDPETLDDLPEGPGVYIFYGENDAPLYVGKSVNLRARVLSHFSADHRSAKDLRLSQQLRRLDWIETVGELGALLTEARLVKELAPLHNRQLRRNQDLCAFRFDPARDARPELVSGAEIGRGALDELFGLFQSRRDATNALRELADAHGLCAKLLGLEKGPGPCFPQQLKKCRGACVGKESAAAHGLRLAAALAALRLKAWPWRGRVGLREADAFSGRAELHVLDRWCYLGTLRSENELFDAARLGDDPAFDPDTYRILTRYLARAGRRAEVVALC